MAEDAPVIPIRGEPTEDAGVRTLPAPPICLHWGFALNEETRRVTCDRCGREVDAFDALSRLSHEIDRYVHRLARLKGDEHLAQARLDDLRRQERNGLDLWHARGFLHLAENAEIVDAADYGHEIDNAGALQAHRARVEAHYAG